MWSISDLKARARTNMKRCYWKMFLVCTIVLVIISVASTVLGGIVGMLSGGGIFASAALSGMMGAFEGDFNSSTLLMFLSVYFIIFISTIAVSILQSTFVNNPLNASHNYYFMRVREGEGEVSDLLFNFQNNYFNTVKILFFQTLYISLWSLLFIIPGIIKYYEYSMVSYIMAENPDMDRSRAFEISRIMTDGEKFKIFVMDLSFIGWYILSSFTCGIGFFFLTPYIKATWAELYAAMRDKMFYTGVAKPDELPGFLTSRI